MSCGCVNTPVTSCPSINTSQIGTLDYVAGLRHDPSCPGYELAADLICRTIGASTVRAASAGAIGTDKVYVVTPTGCVLAALPAGIADVKLASGALVGTTLNLTQTDASVIPVNLSGLLCASLTAISGAVGIANAGTQLLGKDCLVYTVPTVCAQFAAILTAAVPATPGVTVLMGKDCLPYTIAGGLDCEAVQDCVAPMFAPAFTYNDALGTVVASPSTDVNNNFALGTDGKFYSNYNFRVTTGATIIPPAGGIVVQKGDALHFWSATGIGFNVTLGSAVIKVDITKSTDAGNVLTFGTDGKLFVPTPGAFAETPLTVTDSTSVDLTAGVTGNGHTGLTAAVKISATAGNAVVVNADGIFVPTAAAGFITSVLDTPTVDHTVALGVLSSAVKLSAIAGNIITANADGLYASETALTVIDSATVDLTAGLVGSGHTSLTASVKLSATAGNTLIANLDGLFVPTPGAFAETALTVTDSPTVDLTAGGAGNGHTGLTASVKLSSTAGNVLVANLDGLYVPTGTETTLTVTDSSTVDLTAGLTGNGHTGLTAAVKISATAGNSIVANLDGVFSPTPTASTACTIGALIGAATAISTPFRVVGFDALGCLAPTNVGSNLVVFGTETGADNNIATSNNFTYTESTGNLIAGLGGNTSTAARSSVFGLNNANSAESSIVSGQANTNAGTHSSVSGILNNNTGSFSVLGGNNSDNFGQNSIVVGNGLTQNDVTGRVAMFGVNNTNNAGATESFIAGAANTNSGSGSFMVGRSGINTGTDSVVISVTGNNSGNQATIIGGEGHVVSGLRAVNVGGVTNTNSSYAGTILGGTSNNLSGSFIGAGGSLIAGTGNTITSLDSYAFGDGNNVGGTRGFASGNANVITGPSAASTFGNNLNAQGTSQFVIGNWNVAQGSGVAGQNFERNAFIIGNGTAALARRNALSVREDATVQFYPNAQVGLAANNAAAIAALAALPAGNFLFGALTLVNVAGVPSWFKYDGAAWSFAF